MWSFDFFLSTTRNAKAAHRFFAKVLRGLKSWEYPLTINTDKAPAYGQAIRALKSQGKCPGEMGHRQVNI
ncbi:DDE-type integrase/transposase/recombinase [Vibrio sp. ER1A]|uniref:DDE-type integrase/transposase/recombinase n=1 Tax=Vibrio sp. ER1A TaxID=1517681 RepID=UPI0009DFE009